MIGSTAVLPIPATSGIASGASYADAVNALEQLDKIVDSLFGHLSQKVTEQSNRLGSAASRIISMKNRITRLSEEKDRAVVVRSPATHPNPHPEGLLPSLFSGYVPPPVTRCAKFPHRQQVIVDRIDEDPITSSQRIAPLLYEIQQAAIGAPVSDGLGAVSEATTSISSLVLFNSSITPNTNNASCDNLRTRFSKEVRPMLKVPTPQIPPAPSSLLTEMKEFHSRYIVELPPAEKAPKLLLPDMLGLTNAAKVCDFGEDEDASEDSQVQIPPPEEALPVPNKPTVTPQPATYTEKVVIPPPVATKATLPVPPAVPQPQPTPGFKATPPQKQIPPPTATPPQSTPSRLVPPLAPFSAAPASSAAATAGPRPLASASGPTGTAAYVIPAAPPPPKKWPLSRELLQPAAAPPQSFQQQLADKIALRQHHKDVAPPLESPPSQQQQRQRQQQQQQQEQQTVKAPPSMTGTWAQISAKIIPRREAVADSDDEQDDDF